MTSEQFCYWLQGAFEILPDNMELDITQLQVIKDHLNTVFVKVTPERKEQTYCAPLTPIPAICAEEMIDNTVTTDELDSVFQKGVEEQKAQCENPFEQAVLNANLRAWPVTKVQPWPSAVRP